MLPVNQVVNSQRMLETGKYQQPRAKVAEDVWLIKYLMQQGKTREEIYELWKPIYLSRDRGDIGDEVVQTTFRNLCRTAAVKKVKLREQKRIEIFQSELSFIKGLDAPLRTKQFILMLYAYYKAENLKRLEDAETSVVRRNILRVLTAGGRTDDQRLFDVIVELGAVTKEVITKEDLRYGGFYTSTYYKLAKVKHHGTRVAEFVTLSDVPAQLDYLLLYTQCPYCGKEFLPSRKAKTDLCPECYKEKRKADYRSQKAKNVNSTGK